MAINWQQVLTTIGSTAVIVSVFAFLTKSVINHLLTRDVEKFKARLQSDADMEIEKLKNSLQIVAVEHQVRFSKLHERRAEIIADLYARLVDAERMGDRYVTVEAWEETKERQKAYEATERGLVELYFFVEKNRIYLPEPVCELLQQFVLAVRTNAINMHIFVPVEAVSDTLIKGRAEAIKDVFESVQGKIPAARKALESEFRRILGG
jgi:hypothetical protein